MTLILHPIGNHTKRQVQFVLGFGICLLMLSTKRFLNSSQTCNNQVNKMIFHDLSKYVALKHFRKASYWYAESFSKCIIEGSNILVPSLESNSPSCSSWYLEKSDRLNIKFVTNFMKFSWGLDIQSLVVWRQHPHLHYYYYYYY